MGPEVGEWRGDAETKLGLGFSFWLELVVAL